MVCIAKDKIGQNFPHFGAKKIHDQYNKYDHRKNVNQKANNKVRL